MHPDLLNILSNQELPIENERLIAYLTGKLSAAENQEIEQQLASSNLSHEALEGLQMFHNKQTISHYQHSLDDFLQKELGKTNQRRRKQLSMQWPLMWIILAMLLGLSVLVWYLVYYLHK